MSTRTTVVLSDFAETTMPWRTLGLPGPCSGACCSSTTGAAARASARLTFCLARYARRCLALRSLWAARSARRSSSVRGPEAVLALAARAAALRSLRVAPVVGSSEAGAPASLRSSSRPTPSALAAVPSVGVASSGVSGVVSSDSAIVLRSRIDAALARDGQGTGEVALGAAQPGRVLQLARGVLETQAEQLAALGRDVLAQPVVVEVAEFGRLHH